MAALPALRTRLHALDTQFRCMCRIHADTVHAALELCFPPELTLPLLCLQYWRSPAVASLFLAWSFAEVRWRVRVARPSPFHGRLS